MKKNLLNLFLCLILTSSIFAQAPDSFKYQAAVRDASGNILANQNVAFRLSIYQTSITGTVVYSETHNLTTNDYGLANMNIGGGTVVSGDFSVIDWGSDAYFVKTELDAAGGSSFTDMGTSQLQSVPYALNAKSVSGMSMDDLTDVSVSGATVNQILSWDGTNWVPITSSGGTVYSAGTGLSLSGTTFSNTAPDQVITLNQGGSTMITGTYPNFTISSTDNNTTYTAGTGLSLSGTTFSAQNALALWNANQLQGRTVSSAAPITNQVLGWNGTQWAPQTVSGGSTYTAGTGLSLSGNTFSAQNSMALWNANQLQGRSISAAAPTTNQVLGWNGTQWAPTTVSGGGSSEWTPVGSDIQRSTGKVTIGPATFPTKFTVLDYDVSNNIFSSAVFMQGSTSASPGDKTGQLSAIWGAFEDGKSVDENVGIFGSAGGTVGQNIGMRGVVKSVANNKVAIGVSGEVFGNGQTVGRYHLGVRGEALGAGDNNTASENNGIFTTATGNLRTNVGAYFQALGTDGTLNIGIYATAANSTTNYAGYFNGDVAYTGTLTNVSDRRLKTNITPYSGALNKIMKLDIYTYNYNPTGEFANLNLSKEKQYGFLAQDLESLFPDLVHNNKVPNKKVLNEKGTFDVVEGGAEYKSVNQIGMIPILTKGMQEQQALIENQQKLIEKQNQLIQELDNRIKALEKK